MSRKLERQLVRLWERYNEAALRNVRIKRMHYEEHQRSRAASYLDSLMLHNRCSYNRGLSRV